MNVLPGDFKNLPVLKIPQAVEEFLVALTRRRAPLQFLAQGFPLEQGPAGENVVQHQRVFDDEIHQPLGFLANFQQMANQILMFRQKK